MAGAAILWPAIALAGLTFLVWATLVTARLRHLAATPPAPADFASSDAAARYFAPVALPADNLRNLTEMPLLFYAAVALLLAGALVTPAQIGLAWVYVALRAGHSVQHLVTKQVKRRFFLYLASCAVLLAMWVGLAADLARAG